MTSPAELSAALRELSARYLHLDASTLTSRALLTDDLGVDSLTAIEWGMVIEDELAVLLPEEAWAGLTTYGDVEELVGRAVRASAGAGG